MDISFCLPCYNVGKFIKSCFASIEAQRLDSYEIICVDDCSSDDTFNKLNELANINDKVKVIKNYCNKGVSYSRNNALDIASGDYVWFVDPDDILPANAAKYLLNNARKNNADIVLANYIKIDEDDDQKYSIETANILIRRVDMFKSLDWLTDREGNCKMYSMCRGIFRRDFLLENGLLYNENVCMREDTLLYFQMRLKKPLVYKAEFNCYCVRQRKGSAMRGGYSGKFEKLINSSLALLKAYETTNIPDELKSDVQALIDNERKSLVNILQYEKEQKNVRERLRFLKGHGYYPIKCEKGIYRHESAFWIKWFLRKIVR